MYYWDHENDILYCYCISKQTIKTFKHLIDIYRVNNLIMIHKQKPVKLRTNLNF